MLVGGHVVRPGHVLMHVGHLGSGRARLRRRRLGDCRTGACSQSVMVLVRGERRTETKRQRHGGKADSGVLPHVSAVLLGQSRYLDTPGAVLSLTPAGDRARNSPRRPSEA